MGRATVDDPPVRVVMLSRERDDWLRSPGWRADFYVGPFFFYLSTADEGWLAFEVQTRWFRVSWDWKGRP